MNVGHPGQIGGCRTAEDKVGPGSRQHDKYAVMCGQDGGSCRSWLVKDPLGRFVSWCTRTGTRMEARPVSVYNRVFTPVAMTVSGGSRRTALMVAEVICVFPDGVP